MLQAVAECDWQAVDLALRKIASGRAGLDAEGARWLRQAERCQIWRELGMVSAIDYLERVLGYSPRTAQERLRVARALERGRCSRRRSHAGSCRTLPCAS